MNQDLKKGVGILAAVFLLFLSGVITIYVRIDRILGAGDATSTDLAGIVDKLRNADFAPLWYIAAGFASVWIYSVVDAFVKGRKLDQSGMRKDGCGPI